MANYIITYHIRHPHENYSNFYDAIKSNYPEYHHALEETWFIKTENTPKEIVEKIKPFLRELDSIFVGEITDNYYGWLGLGFWDWLKGDKKETTDK